jgi:hypothetical protein
MGQVLRGSATTTEAIRRAIQNSQESLRDLAKRSPRSTRRRGYGSDAPSVSRTWGVASKLAGR